MESRLLDPYGNEISAAGTEEAAYYLTSEPLLLCQTG